MMDLRRLWAVALVVGLSVAQKEVSVCLRANARTCGECIQVSETCGWCSHESFAVGSKSSRCDDVESLVKRQCPPGKIENPRGSITIIKNKPVTDRVKDSPEKLAPEQITQIQPQKLSLTLRPGEPQTFSLRFRRAEDYPIDLYFLMDLSMKDDWENMRNLATDLMRQMQEISSDFRIGLGSIVKTSHAPVCPENQNCSSPFSFKNVLKLTNNRDEFNRLLSQQQMSDLDSAEGGLQAIRQVSVCQEQIGWRHFLRFLVVVTNGNFHFFRDESRQVHDEQCQLQTDTYTNDGQVSWSVSDLANTLSRQNIQTIFSVTENVLPKYQELTKHIPKSSVTTLSSNSSRVLELISEAYSSLSSELILENSQLPEGVSFSYKALCENRAEGTGHKCFNVSMGDEVSFEVSVAAQNCPEHAQLEVVKIKPLGFQEEVEVVLNFICECQCSARGEPHSSKCSHHGNAQCGACNCDVGWVGQWCECSMDNIYNEDLDANCRKDNGNDVCSNNGDCVCGTCECKKRENPQERYSGRFCECDNFNCDRSNNKLCGGHGRCECRMCVCDTGYTGSACDCSLDHTSCLAKNGQICNGRGTCECGVCKCTDPKFQGPTCEICPTCPGVCSEHKDCVQCRAFGSGPKTQTCNMDCSYFTMTTVGSTSDLPQPEDHSFPLKHCKERDADDCWFYFTYSRRQEDRHIHVVQKRDCPTVSVWDSILPPNIKRLV